MPYSFSESDHKRIEEAVRRSELRTSGEIVPFLVGASDSYPVVRWRAGMLFLIVAIITCYGAKLLYPGWGIGWLYSATGLTIVGLVAAILGVISVEFLAPLRRLLVGRYLMSRMVYLGAMQAFVEEEVFKTRDRTGILIFMSMFEHRVQVVGDEGINKVVEQEEWDVVVGKIISGFRDGNVTDGIIAGIEACGELLERHGVEIEPGDVDELSNRLRVRKDI